MKTETALFLNPNQLILVRELQKSACAMLSEFSPVPTLPLCVESAELQSISDKITKAVPKEFFFENERLFLLIELEINRKQCDGKIELCRLLSAKKINKEENLREIHKNTEEIRSKIKKISPFRIVELEREEFENGLKWCVLNEKWEKI